MKIHTFLILFFALATLSSCRKAADSESNARRSSQRTTAQVSILESPALDSSVSVPLVAWSLELERDVGYIVINVYARALKPHVGYEYDDENPWVSVGNEEANGGERLDCFNICDERALADLIQSRKERMAKEYGNGGVCVYLNVDSAARWEDVRRVIMCAVHGGVPHIVCGVSEIGAMNRKLDMTIKDYTNEELTSALQVQLSRNGLVKMENKIPDAPFTDDFRAYRVAMESVGMAPSVMVDVEDETEFSIVAELLSYIEEAGIKNVIWQVSGR